MKQFLSNKITTGVLVSGAVIGISLGSSVSAFAAALNGSANAATNQQQLLQTIQTKGASEIDRRLASLNGLTGEVSSSTKLSAADKTTLNNEITSDISELTTLKTTLAGETTVAAAKTDAQSIFSGYRVYALVLPQTHIVKTADNQQQIETQLSALASSISTKLTGSTDATLSSDLATMNTDIKNAQGLSSSVETDVIALTPSDYNSNKTVLSQYLADLKNAHADNLAAATEAKTILSSLASTKK